MPEDAWHVEFPRRTDMSDGLFAGVNGGLSMWDNFPVFPTKPKREEKVGLAEAITSSILSTGRSPYIYSSLIWYSLIQYCSYQSREE